MVKREYTLNNGKKIPSIGFGTWKLNDPRETTRIIQDALEVGYQHIDSASSYGNEEFLSEAIRKSRIPRDKLFIAGKVWNSDQGYDTTIKACEKSLENLGLEYLDLYLIHWPVPKDHKKDYQILNYETWKALEALYDQGKVKAIGVSNFQKHHLMELMGKPISVQPMVNQIEVHPLYFESDTIQFCEENKILVEGYSPLMRGNNLDLPIFLELAEKYNKTPAQICLRWCLQKNIIPLPKSTNRERMKQNLAIYDFEINDDDMTRLDYLQMEGEKIGSYPDNINF